MGRRLLEFGRVDPICVVVVGFKNGAGDVDLGCNAFGVDEEEEEDVGCNSTPGGGCVNNEWLCIFIMDGAGTGRNVMDGKVVGERFMEGRFVVVDSEEEDGETNEEGVAFVVVEAPCPTRTGGGVEEGLHSTSSTKDTRAVVPPPPPPPLRALLTSVVGPREIGLSSRRRDEMPSSCPPLPFDGGGGRNGSSPPPTRSSGGMALGDAGNGSEGEDEEVDTEGGTEHHDDDVIEPELL